jgi:3-oxoadipate enol-lactonase
VVRFPVLDLDGRRLHYDDDGEGPPVVLSHGAIESIRSWAEIARILRRRFRVVAYDARGRGRSSMAPVAYPAMAQDVTLLAERLHLVPFFHVGHSMGGRVALEHALTRPGEVRAVAALSARAEGSDEATQAKLDELIENVHRDGPGAAARMWIDPGHPLHGRVREISAANPLQGTVAALACARDAAALPLDGLVVPVLTVVGADDTRYLASARAIGGELHVLDDVGHFPNLEAPELVAELLADFFDRYV